MNEEYWATARKVCSDKELEVLVWRDKHHLTPRLISLQTGISRWSVRDRLENADRKIQLAMKGEAA